jgi:hypothetical protein
MESLWFHPEDGQDGITADATISAPLSRDLDEGESKLISSKEESK